MAMSLPELGAYWGMARVVRSYEDVAGFSLLGQTVIDRLLPGLEDLLLPD